MSAYIMLYLKRLVSIRRNEPFLSLSRIIGFKPGRPELYKLALRHRSRPLIPGHELLSNERLEFLGDAVLNAVVSDFIYQIFPQEQEGFLSEARAALVKRETLNRICREIGLDKLLVADEQVKTQKSENVYGNALEALIGAIYLDKGYKKSRQFIENKILPPPQSLPLLVNENKNFKSQLYEWCQEHRLNLDFKLLQDKTDNFNRHHFVTRAVINNISACEGEGQTKKEAQQEAARHTLKKVENDRLFREAIMGAANN